MAKKRKRARKAASRKQQAQRDKFQRAHKTCFLQLVSGQMDKPNATMKNTYGKCMKDHL